MISRWSFEDQNARGAVTPVFTAPLRLLWIALFKKA